MYRVQEFYHEIIYKQLLEEKNILISAHGNSIRAMIKIFENIDDKSIEKVEVPTGDPIFYEFSEGNVLKK